MWQVHQGGGIRKRDRCPEETTPLRRRRRAGWRHLHWLPADVVHVPCPGRGVDTNRKRRP
jgi:hypothetical protein